MTLNLKKIPVLKNGVVQKYSDQIILQKAKYCTMNIMKFRDLFNVG